MAIIIMKNDKGTRIRYRVGDKTVMVQFAPHLTLAECLSMCGL